MFDGARYAPCGGLGVVERMHALRLLAAAWCGRAGVGSSDAGLTWTKVVSHGDVRECKCWGG